MSDVISLWRAKVDAIAIELAGYETEKASIEAAKKKGVTRPRSGVKLAKLQGSIRGAKLRLSNAEKKLRDALVGKPQDSLQPDSPPVISHPSETDLKAVDSLGHRQGAGPPGPMDVDNSLVDGRRADPPMPPPFPPSFGVSPSAIYPVDSLMASKPVLDNHESPAAQVPSLPTNGSEKSSLSFTQMGLGESDTEVGPTVPVLDMNLVTVDGAAQLQRDLFKSRFTTAPPPKKKVKFVGVSDDSDGAGDSDIFYDDDDDRSSGQGVLAKSSKPKPMVKPPLSMKGVGREKDSKDGDETGAGPSKGKGHDKDLKGRERIGQGASKLDERSKGPKGGKKAEASKDKVKEGGGNNDEEKDREDYHASEPSLAKAARVAATLSKQRMRLADEETHRQFAEDWLNATTSAGRPIPPTGIELIRFDPEYLPDVAIANYHLALQLLLNQTANYLCIPHVKLDRKLVSRVDNLEGPVQIWGTPLRRNQNPNLKSNISRPLNHFHCGCHEKVALAGFVMWKTWKARAMINGQLVVEGLHRYKPFQPRDVLFILQFLKSKFGYTVEDMFTGSFDEEEELRKEAQVMKKVANFCARRHLELIGQKLTLDDNFSVEEEESVPEWI